MTIFTNARVAHAMTAIAAVCMTAAAAEQPGRDLSQFAALMARSPFSLPTAEETSPLAERYALTGAVAWDGRQRVFILDRTSQQRHILSEGTTEGEMMLLEFLADADPRRMRARVQIGGQVATLSFLEAGFDGNPSPMQAGGDQAPMIAPGMPGANINPGDPGPPRRIIRRRVITGTNSQQAGQPVNGQPQPGDGGPTRVIQRQVVSPSVPQQP